LEHLRPGVFAGGPDLATATSVLANTKSWGWPLLEPPVAIVYATASGDADVVVTVTHRPAFSDLAS
jgi:hypothetical protein